jgi:hypothetical protein
VHSTVEFQALMAEDPHHVKMQLITSGWEPSAHSTPAPPVLSKLQLPMIGLPVLQTMPVAPQSAMMQLTMVGLLDQQLMVPDPQHP